MENVKGANPPCSRTEQGGFAIKNAQISAEALVYILGFFIISLIFVLGYKYSKELKSTQDASSFLIFRNNLRSDVANARQDYGSAKFRDYNLPEGADEICFVDKSRNNPLLCSGCPKSTDYRIIVDSVSSNSTNNVFLFGESSIKNTFRLESIKIGCCAFKCYKAKKGNLKLSIEGDGKYALISQI